MASVLTSLHFLLMNPDYPPAWPLRLENATRMNVNVKLETTRWENHTNACATYKFHNLV